MPLEPSTSVTRNPRIVVPMTMPAATSEAVLIMNELSAVRSSPPIDSISSPVCISFEWGARGWERHR